MLGIYVHVPFCASRCAYCDFNTYTASELRGRDARAGFAADAIAEVDLAARTLSGERPLVSTVFFGGGTPTLLPAVDLVRILRAVDERLGLVPGAEVTVEANPESVDPAVLALLREHGVTRVSLGMQSVAPHVLAVLERAHTPGRAQAAAAEARAAGIEHVSLDLIFGTPGETDADWAASLDAALAAGPDHVSVYGLTLAAGTRLDARVRRGDLPAPDDDAMADRYLAADAALGAAGLGWYELSNWAAGEEARCRHNVGYWRGADWWGVGPGAHSHLDGRRWWNVRHPSDYAARLAAGHSPVAGAEVLAPEARRLERIMLETRTADGLDAGVLRAAGADAARRMAGERLLEDGALAAGRVRLTLGGRLVADAVVRSLADA
ncbi:MAG TPA: radical SAM family heme chaperone HemW [Solirubrobacteraceae bacterium]|nr:radical SAM family heme chaperone HemW [Solirubrobacteraceae bacterium]